MGCRVWAPTIRWWPLGLRLLRASCVWALTGTPPPSPLSPVELWLPKASIIPYPSSHQLLCRVRHRHCHHLCASGDTQAQRGTDWDQCRTAAKVLLLLPPPPPPIPPASPGVTLSGPSCLGGPPLHRTLGVLSLNQLPRPLPHPSVLTLLSPRGPCPPHHGPGPQMSVPDGLSPLPGSPQTVLTRPSPCPSGLGVLKATGRLVGEMGNVRKYV